MKNITKDSRLASRDAQFNSLISSGFERETYKELDFFTKQDGQFFTLKVFRGTAANHEDYRNYRSLARRDEVVQNYKNNYESRLKYKAEQKEKNKGKSSSHAGASAAVKAELCAAFPGIKFSCTSDSFSGGNAVRISWNDGPTVAQVSEISDKYQYGHFNGMEDIYEYSNRNENIPQVKFVSESRHMSKEVENILLPVAVVMFEGFKKEGKENPYNCWNAETFLYQIFYACAIPAGATVTGIEPTGETCGLCSPSVFFKIGYTLPEGTEPTKPIFSEVEAVHGEINIIDYSEKAFAVVGDTKPIKDKLKALGGSFNARLSCGAGWIFSKKKLEEVTHALSQSTPDTKEIENINFPVVVTQEAIDSAKEYNKATYPDTPVFPTPETDLFKLEYFKIIWHEGYQVPSYEGATFDNWEEVQAAFVSLWETNERGQDGGYTKVKCEMKFEGKEQITDRIDITNRVGNGDFNPSQEHIVTYLQTLAKKDEQDTPDPKHVKTYDSLEAIREAAKCGHVISLYNLSQLTNHQKRTS